MKINRYAFILSSALAITAGFFLIFFNAIRDMGDQGNDRLVYADEFYSLLSTGEKLVEFRGFEILLTHFYRLLIASGVTSFETATLVVSLFCYMVILWALYNIRSRYNSSEYWVLVFLVVAFLNYLWPSFAVRQALSIAFIFLSFSFYSKYLKVVFMALAISSHYYAIFILALYLVARGGLKRTSKIKLGVAASLLPILLIGYWGPISGEINSTFLKLLKSDVSLHDSIVLTMKVTYLLPLIAIVALRNRKAKIVNDPDVRGYILCAVLSISVLFIPYASLRFMAYFSTVAAGVIVFKIIKSAFKKRWKIIALAVGWSKIALAMANAGFA